jgi:hypothetical protein
MAALPPPAPGKGKPPVPPSTAKPKGPPGPGTIRKPLLRSLLIAAGEDSIPPGLGDDVDVVNAEDLDDKTLVALQAAAAPSGSVGEVQDQREEAESGPNPGEPEDDTGDDDQALPPPDGDEGAASAAGGAQDGADGDEGADPSVGGEDASEPPTSSSIPPSPPGEEVDEELAGQEGQPGEPDDAKLSRLGPEAEQFAAMSTGLGDKVLGALASQTPVDQKGLGFGPDKRKEVRDAISEVEEGHQHVLAATEAGDVVEATKALQSMRQAHQVIAEVAQALGLAGDEMPDDEPGPGGPGAAPMPDDGADEGLGSWAKATKAKAAPTIGG